MGCLRRLTTSARDGRHGGLALPSTVLLAVVLALVLGSCSAAAGTGSDGGVPGCGPVPPRRLVDLVGSDHRTTSSGTLQALRTKHEALRCRTVAVGRPDRLVELRAQFHPTPLPLPRKDCNQGWVFAGTPAKYGTACQETDRRGSRTVLLARWGRYVMRVTIVRPKEDWAGDPERGIELTRRIARKLGVPEATRSS